MIEPIDQITPEVKSKGHINHPAILVDGAHLTLDTDFNLSLAPRTNLATAITKFKSGNSDFASDKQLRNVTGAVILEEVWRRMDSWLEQNHSFGYVDSIQVFTDAIIGEVFRVEPISETAPDPVASLIHEALGRQDRPAAANLRAACQGAGIYINKIMSLLAGQLFDEIKPAESDPILTKAIETWNGKHNGIPFKYVMQPGFVTAGTSSWNIIEATLVDLIRKDALTSDNFRIAILSGYTLHRAIGMSHLTFLNAFDRVVKYGGHGIIPLLDPDRDPGDLRFAPGALRVAAKIGFILCDGHNLFSTKDERTGCIAFHARGDSRGSVAREHFMWNVRRAERDILPVLIEQGANKSGLPIFPTQRDFFLSVVKAYAATHNLGEILDRFSASYRTKFADIDGVVDYLMDLEKIGQPA